ncbi:hypothetical protein EW093_12530 [Thiospirochaeta perfilievii]|uniref:Band 7 domain-containing protein n=1 Tax=Thiospirochaeta perfilievii TaxID=252967 RepID=A0A5C1QBQ5_9SPIO|nr:SPFH domain-containing protein [Thiospirochaeta perfilievii]QEN05505.1 hypothetical protein EW093_12530 [Thiospirochaeta perfilievii]
MGEGKSTSPRKVGVVVFVVIAVAALLFLSNSLVTTNKSGYYQVKQAAVTGTMSVRSKPGMYPQLFGDITTYQISDMYYFSKYDEEGGSGFEAAPIKVRFNDGGTAEISGSIKYRLSLVEDTQISLHADYKSYEAVKQDLVRQVVTEALMQTATLMKAEESYSSRRSEFTSLAEEQVKLGIFETSSEEIKTKDADGNQFIERYVEVKVGPDGQRLIRKESPFVRYQIEVLQFVIKDIDFDQTIDSLIAKKKEAEQQRVVAKANAERAKQDAITAEEQGKAKEAEAKALENVEKIKAVTKAEKERDVANLRYETEKLNALATLEKAKAEAEKNRLLVSAGLAPEMEAQINKEVAIGVAAELAKVKFPEMMILGGSNGGALNPFDAVGLESFLKIQKEFSAKE